MLYQFSNPKDSSGKFVLAVDIVGDNATYRRESIDYSKSESATTESPPPKKHPRRIGGENVKLFFIQQYQPILP